MLTIYTIDIGGVSKTRLDNVLFNLQKSVVNNSTSSNGRSIIVPDIVIVFDANRYVLHHLFKKDWTKYYFSTISKRERESSPTLFTIVLTRWPFVQTQTFPKNITPTSLPTTNVIDLSIPLNNIPIRSEYEDNAHLNISGITLVVSKLAIDYPKDMCIKHISVINEITQHNPNVFYFYGNAVQRLNNKIETPSETSIEQETVRKPIEELIEELVKEPITEEFVAPPTLSLTLPYIIEDMMYSTEGWKMENSVNECGIDKYFFSLSI